MKIYGNRKGFTLLEVVAVLIIMGIMTAVALTRLVSNQNNLFAATDTLTSQLRLAQARAMNTDASNVNICSNSWGVSFSSPTQYYLFNCPDKNVCTPATNQKSFPGGGNIIMDLAPKGVQVNGTPLVLAFDRFGTPYSDAALTTPLAAQLTITLQDNKGNTRTINITPQTGMIKKG
jgi:prepilin-type N-terminal cleavage/methylation domain-containing protein